MYFCDVNPFIRFAAYIKLVDYEKTAVLVQDCRIFYAVSGETDIFIKNEHYVLVPGTLFYCSAGSVYALQTKNATILALNFDLTQNRNTHIAPYPVMPAQNGSVDLHFGDLNIEDSPFMNGHLFLSDANDYEASFHSILEEFSTQRIFFRDHSSAILKGMLSQMHRHSIRNTSNAMDVVSKTITYIKSNYSRNLSNKMLSDLTGYHEYHLNRLFVRHTGTTVHRYILNLRINRAKDLLLNTSLSLAAIAECVGFNSNTHFSEYFKQVVGIPPMEFRKRMKNI